VLHVLFFSQAKIMSSTLTALQSKSDELLQVLRGYDRIFVVMHDNPDPDAIAAGWGVQVLIEEKLSAAVRLVGGGAIVRAENRHMVDLLAPPIELVDHVDFDAGSAAVLVDCGAEATNHVVTRQQIKPVAIIDHHSNGQLPQASYLDIRPDAAASATIVASYLREQQIELGPKLATAMLYAVRTETCGHETHFSQLDRSILPWLTEHGDPALLAEIENAPLTRDYFADLLLALQSTFLYDDAAICFLPRASGAEIVGEVADMLIRCDGIRRVLCATIVAEDLLISARTQPGHGSATELLQTTLEGIGGAGGHSHRAGGKIYDVGHSTKFIEALHDDLRSRWLTACGVQRKRGTRLIPKRKIVENLER
jgi:nanoRNase/pAp phosphatase (c-di-AMP/oligoRNAs hydrolase)